MTDEDLAFSFLENYTDTAHTPPHLQALSASNDGSKSERHPLTQYASETWPVAWFVKKKATTAFPQNRCTILSRATGLYPESVGNGASGSNPAEMLRVFAVCGSTPCFCSDLTRRIPQCSAMSWRPRLGAFLSRLPMPPRIIWYWPLVTSCLGALSALATKPGANGACSGLDRRCDSSLPSMVPECVFVCSCVFGRYI